MESHLVPCIADLKKQHYNRIQKVYGTTYVFLYGWIYQKQICLVTCIRILLTALDVEIAHWRVKREDGKVALAV